MKLAALVLAGVLAGCAVSPIDRGIEAAKNRDYATAQAYFRQAVEQGNPWGWNNLGAIAAEQGNHAEAIQYFSMGARYGLSTSQQALIRLGAPVPSPDLAQARAADAAAAAQIMQATMPRPAPQPIFQPLQIPQPVNCTSRAVGNTVRTNCY